jgi:hypothetical protein
MVQQASSIKSYAATCWQGADSILLTLLKQHPVELCQNVSQQHALFIRRSHQDRVREHLCYICRDCRGRAAP